MTTKSSTSTTSYTKILPWLICGIGALFYSYEYFLRILPSIMTGDLMRYFNIDAAMFGGVSAFYYYAYVPMQLPVGILMDRFGPRRLLTLACLLCVTGTYLFVASTSLVLASIGRFTVGFGSAFAFVGVLKLATIWLPENKFAMFAGLAAALGTVGAITGDIVLTQFVSTLGWHASVTIASLLGLVIAVLLWFVIKDRGSPTNHERQIETFGQSMKELAVIIKNPQIWVNGLIGCFIYLPTTVFGELWGPSYLEHAHYFTPDEAAAGIALLFWGFTLGAPLIGWISDTIRKRRVPMFIGAVFATILATILIYMPGLSHTAIYFLLFFLGMAYGAQALVFAVGREISPENAAGTAIAVTNMIVMLGGIIFQPVVGILLDLKGGGIIAQGVHVYTAGDYQFALAVLPIGVAIAAILPFFLKESGERLVRSH